MTTPFHAVVPAAGRGRRAGGPGPKQFQSLAGRSMLAHTLDALGACPGLAGLVVPVGEEDEEDFARVVAELGERASRVLLPPARGGATRALSVRAGLDALARSGVSLDDIVLVHDGARPFAGPELVARVAAAAEEHGAAVPGIPLVDALARVGDGRLAGGLDRGGVRRIQTPQGFRLGLLRDAHAAAAAAGLDDLVDDAAALTRLGIAVAVVDGEEGNLKVTTPTDVAEAERRLSGERETRIGQGYDVHALVPGDAVVLGGVRIPHDRALSGHSDADVVLHALTDALLGAICDGDIGVHFPPSDPRWRGAASDRFLADAARRVRERGGRIVLLDATIVCEEPKIGPHREAMRAAIARAADLTPDRVAIKATTSERLGFTGRGEGIAALALATVELPRGDG